MPTLEGFTNGFGERIALARKMRTLTQDQIAKHLGINKLTVSHWEHERQKPSAHIVRLAALLHVTPNWIMEGRESSAFIEKTKFIGEYLKEHGDELRAEAEKLKTTLPRSIDTDHHGPSPPKARDAPKARMIPLWGSVAAGSGAVIEPGVAEDHVDDMGSGADFALTVSGESMEPVMRTRDRMFCKRVEVILPPFDSDAPFQVPAEKVRPLAGKVCVVTLNGHGFVKRLIVEMDKKRRGKYTCHLESLHAGHAKIKVERSDECLIQGVAVGLYREL